MQEQTQKQLLSELEKRLSELETDIAKNGVFPFERGRTVELRFAISLIKSITTNRSSQEPKIKE